MTAILNKEVDFCVYAHINKINGKCYIGYTNDVFSRWENNGYKYKSCPRFWSAIVHYGWDSFEHIILEDKLSYDKALEKEKYYIKKYNALNFEYGYNLTEGGTGGNTHIGWTEPRKREYSRTCTRELQRRVENGEWSKNLSEAQKERWKKIKQGLLPQPNLPKGKEVHNARAVKNIETNEIFDCCADAVESLGYPRSKSNRISRVANGIRHTFAGYHWEFIDE